MAHAITGTSALPALTTLAADIEGSHAVMVSQGELGTQVVLHHRPHEYTPAVEDHNDALARALVRLCRTSEGGDHRLSTETLSSGLPEKDEQSRVKRQAQPDAQTYITGTRWICHASVLPARAVCRDTVRIHGTTWCSVEKMLSSVRLVM